MATYEPIVPAENVSMPPVQQPQVATPPPQAPVMPQEQAPVVQKGKSGILGIIIVLILLLVGIGGGGFYLFSQQKKDIKDKSNTQVGYFSNIEEVYKNILTIEKGDSQTTPTDGNKLLGVNTEEKEIKDAIAGKGKILGIEDDADVKLARRLSELYKQALDNTTKIANLNKIISAKSNSIPTKLLLKEKPPISQTETFVKETAGLLTYLDTSNNLSIEAMTMGTEIGVAINEALLRKADTTSVDKLEEKIKNLATLKTKFIAIDTTSLTDEMKKEHLDSISSLDKEFKIFDEILQAFKLRDGNLLEKSLQSLVIQAATDSQTGVVENVSFWQQNPTVRSLQTVKESWQNYLKQI